MTEHNLFQEVADDLERQKLEALWKRYGGFVLGGAVLIILATAGFSAWHSWRLDREQKATDALVEVLRPEKVDAEKRVSQLEAYASEHHGDAHASIAQLRAAAFEARDDHKDRAAQIYDKVAQDPRADTVFRQFADLMSVKMQMDTKDPAPLIARLDPLTVANAPWRYTALEYQGYLAIKANDKAKARQIFTSLSQDASAPPSLNERASDMLRYIGE